MEEENTAQKDFMEMPKISEPPAQPNMQKPPKPVFNVLGFVLVLIVGGVIGYFIGTMGNQKMENQSMAPQPTTSEQPTSPSESMMEKKKALLEKEVEGGKFVAYKTETNSVNLPSVFSVSLESGENPVEVYSVSNPAYSQDNLYDIVGDQLWVVNGQTNNFDVYSYQVEKKDADTTTPSALTYKESVALPKYDVGTLYSIKCDNGGCDVYTAMHQESGCTMKLDPTTKKYSDISCSGLGGEVTPKPL